MTALVASLPMYDWPEVRADTDAQWARLRDRLRAAGVDAPERLTRRNGDLPAVPGGIRDPHGTVIAPDPATLPPDEFDLATLWRHPALLFSQTCWGPMETTGLEGLVTVVGQPDYAAFEGGQGELYSSAVVMRALPSPLWGSEGRARLEARPGASPGGRGGGQASTPDTPTPALRTHKGEGKSALHRLPLHLLRNSRLAFNNPDSMSGLIGLTRDLEALGESLSLFTDRIETGSHRASIRAVAEGRADVATIDCRSWALARRFEPAATAALRIVGWTALRKGLPYITGKPQLAARIVAALADQPDRASG